MSVLARERTPLLSSPPSIGSDRSTTKCWSLCQWYQRKPLSRWPYVLMICLILLSFGIVFLRILGYILLSDLLAALIALLLAGYGANHFRVLLYLDEYEDLNAALKIEIARLRVDENKWRKAKRELHAIKIRLQNTTQSYEQNLTNFKSVDERLTTLSEESRANIEQIQRLEELSETIQDSIIKEMTLHEQRMLYLIRERLGFIEERRDKLSRQEYYQYVRLLPRKMQDIFTIEGDFNEVAGYDGYLQIYDFQRLCDKLAVQRVKTKVKKMRKYNRL